VGEHRRISCVLVNFHDDRGVGLESAGEGFGRPDDITVGQSKPSSGSYQQVPSMATSIAERGNPSGVIAKSNRGGNPGRG
jgi:hypothetical protein